MALNLRQHLNKTTPTVNDFVLANTQGAMLKFFMVLNVAAAQLHVSAKQQNFAPYKIPHYTVIHTTGT